MHELPEGHSWRRPTIDDAPAVFALVAAYNQAVVGSADFTLDDMVDQLAEPGVDLESDAWLVHGVTGELAGFGWSCRNGSSAQVDIEVYSFQDEVIAWLFDAVLHQAGRVAAAADLGSVQVDLIVYRDDESRRARAAERGFALATTFHRMRIDHAGATPDPTPGDGVVLRSGPSDEQFRRDAHSVLNTSFADHFGFASRSFEEWHDRTEASATHDWAQLRVAYVDGEPVAMLLGADPFVEDENCGYVHNVGVLPSARGRGLARVLLQQAFADDVRRGRVGTVLHVDTNNATPALDLYLGVGMRAVLVVDAWRRDLERPVAAGGTD